MQIQDALQRAAYGSNSEVNTIFQVLLTKESPPSYFGTNKFTNAFKKSLKLTGEPSWTDLSVSQRGFV